MLQGISLTKGTSTCTSSVGTAVVQTIVASLILFTAVSAGQAQRAAQPEVAANVPQMSQKDLAALQDQLLQELRVSPTLAEVVARDPSLLSNSEYVNRNNPELGRFLQGILKSRTILTSISLTTCTANMRRPARRWSASCGRRCRSASRRELTMRLISDGVPFLVFVCILGALLWLTHVLLENRRWSRIFKLQTDVHGKLIERFGTSQEVLTYMSTDAGKRFLEATPIAVGFEPQQPVPSPVARVLTPLQIGVVMTLLGLGFLSLRHSLPEGSGAFLVIGTVVLMPGLGFIISAGITWVLARHLGLMPNKD